MFVSIIVDELQHISSLVIVKWFGGLAIKGV